MGDPDCLPLPPPNVRIDSGAERVLYCARPLGSSDRKWLVSLRQRISVALGAFLLAGWAVLPVAAQQGRWEKLNEQVKTL
jgi:hypothetical protein